MEKIFVELKPFLSTPSARRATASLTLKAQIEKIFLSTPSARRATVAEILIRAVAVISIHALREEGDDRCSTN